MTKLKEEGKMTNKKKTKYGTEPEEISKSRD
jgi:hypothetical protein